MASLFEQYEQLSSVSNNPLIDDSNQVFICIFINLINYLIKSNLIIKQSIFQNNSIINIRSDSEVQIFSKYKIDFS